MGRHRKHNFWTPQNWDDGYVVQGYMMVYRPDYLGYHHKKRGYARRCHVVWWLTTGQLPPKGFDIHHVNGNKLDDVFDNLRLMTHGEHSTLHNSGPEMWVNCHWCGAKIRVRPSTSDTKFCSLKCKGKQRTNDRPHVPIICRWCGKEFYVNPFRKDKAKFCSMTCRAAYERENRK